MKLGIAGDDDAATDGYQCVNCPAGVDGTWTVNIVVMSLPALSASNCCKTRHPAAARISPTNPGRYHREPARLPAAPATTPLLLCLFHQRDTLRRILMPARRDRKLPYRNIHICPLIINSVKLATLTHQIAGIYSVTTPFSCFIGGGRGALRGGS